MPRELLDWRDTFGSERFEVRPRLGAGSFGVVYEAFDRERGSRVALKVLRDLTPEALYRFKQEFRALTNISHKNLLTLYELLSEGERWFFTMELIEGCTFLDWYVLQRCSLEAARRRLTQRARHHLRPGRSTVHGCEMRYTSSPKASLPYTGLAIYTATSSHRTFW